MSLPNENTNPPKIPLFIWFFEVISVLCLCCVVIIVCVYPWPPTYTLKNLSIHGTQDGGNFSVRNHAEIKRRNMNIMFSLLITNENTAKDVVYGETRITLYKNGSLIGARKLPAFFQRRKSNSSSLVLVNVNQQRMKFGVGDESGILKIGLETKVRYIVLGLKSEQHLLNLEAFVPIDVSGKVSLGDEGIKLERMRNKT